MTAKLTNAFLGFKCRVTLPTTAFLRCNSCGLRILVIADEFSAGMGQREAINVRSGSEDLAFYADHYDYTCECTNNWAVEVSVEWPLAERCSAL